MAAVRSYFTHEDIRHMTLRSRHEVEAELERKLQAQRVEFWKDAHRLLQDTLEDIVDTLHAGKTVDLYLKGKYTVFKRVNKRKA